MNERMNECSLLWRRRNAMNPAALANLGYDWTQFNGSIVINACATLIYVLRVC